MEIIEVNISEAKKSGQGILLMALGHNLYGKLALNLALGLKKVQPDIRIALIHDAVGISELNEAQKFLFDIKIVCPKDYCMLGESPCYVKPKLFLDKLTPFNETLFLDADMIWCPYTTPAQVLQQYSGINFTMANRGENAVSSGVSDWVDMELMKTNFGILSWIDLSSEWIYFRQGSEIAELFNTARVIYDDSKFICKGFAGGKPDEPAFCIAMLKTGIRPHKMPYYPTYWEPVHRHKDKQYIMNNYHALSLGGKYISDRVRGIADNLVGHYQYFMHIEGFKNVSKFKYIKERTLI